MLAMLVPEVLRPKRTDINEIDSNDTNNEMTAIRGCYREGRKNHGLIESKRLIKLLTGRSH